MSDRLIVRRETHELKILAYPRIKETWLCDCCGREVRWLIPEEAMALAEISLREVFRLVEDGEIHFVESAEGYLAVCADSLAVRGEKT